MIELFEDEYPISYRLDGKVHRANGPAIIWESNWIWRMRGESHRYYGPCSNYGYWCIHGRTI